MNQLTTYTGNNSPALPEDLAKFILVGREKLQSVKAEIRAIDKLHLAEEVREQKRDEARMLSEALLDTEMRIGELLKKIPKAPGARTDLKPTDSIVARLQPSTKREAVEALGFTSKQAERFETLASHPDFVEQVKAEARENDDLPTRTAVLNLIKYKEERARAEDRQIDEDARLSKKLDKALTPILTLPTDRNAIEAMRRGLPIEIVADTINDIEQAIGILRMVLLGFKTTCSVRRTPL